MVKEWFREHETSFSHMAWPPQGPDVNPTESVWRVLQKTLHVGLNVSSSEEDLGEKLIQLWREINVVPLHNLIKIMSQQIRGVIKPERLSNKIWLYSFIWVRQCGVIVHTWLLKCSLQYIYEKKKKWRTMFLHMKHESWIWIDIGEIKSWNALTYFTRITTTDPHGHFGAEEVENVNMHLHPRPEPYKYKPDRCFWETRRGQKWEKNEFQVGWLMLANIFVRVQLSAVKLFITN